MLILNRLQLFEVLVYCILCILFNRFSSLASVCLLRGSLLQYWVRRQRLFSSFYFTVFRFLCYFDCLTAYWNGLQAYSMSYAIDQSVTTTTCRASFQFNVLSHFILKQVFVSVYPWVLGWLLSAACSHLAGFSLHFYVMCSFYSTAVLWLYVRYRKISLKSITFISTTDQALPAM